MTQPTKAELAARERKGAERARTRRRRQAQRQNQRARAASAPVVVITVPGQGNGSRAQRQGMILPAGRTSPELRAAYIRSAQQGALGRG